MSSHFQSPDLLKLVIARQRASRYGSTLIYLGHCAGFGTLIVGCAALAGYAFQYEPLWRPIPGGSATHPMTAIGLIAGGAGVALIRPLRIPLASQILLGLVAALGLIRIAELALGMSVIDQISPFSETLAREAAQGLPVRMGWNTAAMFVLIPSAFLLRLLGRPRWAEVVAAVGLCTPLASTLTMT